MGRKPKQALMAVVNDPAVTRMVGRLTDRFFYLVETPPDASIEAIKNEIATHLPLIIMIDAGYPSLPIKELVKWITDYDNIEEYILILHQENQKDLLKELADAGADLFVSKADIEFALPGIVKMVTRHEEKHIQLRQKDAQLESILQTQKEMICRFLPDTTLTYVNKAYADAFGKAPGELIGTRFLDLIPQKEHKRIKKFLKSYTPERSSQTYRHAVIIPDGNTAWHEWTDQAFFDDAGNVVSFQSTGHDVTREFELIEALTKSEAKERKLLARDLHDHIGQMLIYLKLRMEAGVAETDPDIKKEICKETLDLVISISKELRNVSYRMVAGFVSGQSFRKIVEDMIGAFETMSNIRVKFCTDYMPENLNENAQINLFRIMQEALTNVMKHAGAKSINISLFERNEELRLIIRDDGNGTDLSKAKVKNGLVSIKHRTEMLYGSVDFSSKPGRYFRIEVRAPIDRVLCKMD